MRKEITKAKITYCYSLCRLKQSVENRKRCGVGSGWAACRNTMSARRHEQQTRTSDLIQALGFWMFGCLARRAAGLFRVVLRIDGESLVILASQTCLLERLDIDEKVFLSLSVRTKLGWIQLLCNELAGLSLRQKGDGIVQHVENKTEWPSTQRDRRKTRAENQGYYRP
jgi:hypothetical protein